MCASAADAASSSLSKTAHKRAAYRAQKKWREKNKDRMAAWEAEYIRRPDVRARRRECQRRRRLDPVKLEKNRQSSRDYRKTAKYRETYRLWYEKNRQEKLQKQAARNKTPDRKAYNARWMRVYRHKKKLRKIAIEKEKAETVDGGDARIAWSRLTDKVTKSIKTKRETLSPSWRPKGKCKLCDKPESPVYQDFCGIECMNKYWRIG